MIKEELRIRFLVAVALLGILLEVIYYSSSLVYTNFSLFFVILVIVITPALYAIFFHPEHKYLIFLLILIIAVFVNLTYPFYSMGLPYIPPFDAIFHWRVTNTIITTHHVQILKTANDPYIGSTLVSYSDYPGFQLLLAILSMVTGLNSVLVIELCPLISVIGPFLVYSLSQFVFKSRQISFLAAFLWIFAPFSYPAPTYTLLAYIFLLMFLLCLIKYGITGKWTYFLLGLISLFALSMTHHVTIYITLVLVIFLFIFQRIPHFASNKISFLRRQEKNVSATTLYLSFLSLGILWVITNGYPVLTNQLQTIIKSLFAPYGNTGFMSLSSSSVTTSPFEKLVIIVSLLLVCFLGLIGFIKYVSRDKWNAQFVGVTAFFGLIAFISIPMIKLNPSIAAFAVRTPIFLFICLGPLFGYAVFKIMPSGENKKRLLSVLLILLLICVSASMVDLMPRNSYYFSNEKATGQLWEVRDNSESLYGSILWYARSIPQSSIAISDVPIHDIGTGMQNLSITYYSELYASPLMIDQNVAQLRSMAVNYVFINDLMSSYTEQWTYQVYTKPVPVSNLEFLSNNVTVFNNIYDNGIIQILYLHK